MQRAPQRPAEASGTLTIGGDLTVYRLGFGALHITGPGIWGPPRDRQEVNAHRPGDEHRGVRAGQRQWHREDETGERAEPLRSPVPPLGQRQQ